MFGFHVGKGDGMSKSLAESVEWSSTLGFKMQTAQIFVMGPSNRKVNIPDSDRPKIRKVLADNKLFLAVHSAYVARVFGDNAQYGRFLVKTELEICSDINASAFIIHLPRAPIGVVVEGYRAIHKYLRRPTKIYLETASMKRSEITYETPEKLLELYRQLIKVDPEVGLCIDTSHLWAQGINMSDPKVVSEWFDKLDQIGIRNIMFHLNDNKHELDSGRDHHAGLTKGQIWSNSADSLIVVLNYIMKNNSPVILERNGEALPGDFEYLIAKKLAKTDAKTDAKVDAKTDKGQTKVDDE
jgi:endonuclease IV